MAISGAAAYSSAFSQKQFQLLPGHEKLHYEVDKNTATIPVISKEKKKVKTKFDNLLNSCSSKIAEVPKSNNVNVSAYYYSNYFLYFI